MTHNTKEELVSKAKADLVVTLRPYYEKLVALQRVKKLQREELDNGWSRFEYGEDTAEEKHIKEIIQKHVDATKKYVDELIEEIG